MVMHTYSHLDGNLMMRVAGQYSDAGALECEIGGDGRLAMHGALSGFVRIAEYHLGGSAGEVSQDCPLSVCHSYLDGRL